MLPSGEQVIQPKRVPAQLSDEAEVAHELAHAVMNGEESVRPAPLVPAADRVGLDEDERRSPARPSTREPRPEQAIRPREARSLGRAREHHELLAQGEALQDDVAPGA